MSKYITKYSGLEVEHLKERIFNKKALKIALSIILVLSIFVSCSLISTFATNTEDEAYKSSLRQKGFPELYLDKLLQMHKDHPNWKFEPMITGLDWDDAVANESSGGRCLVYIQPNTLASATRLYRSQSVGSYTSKAGFDYDYVVRDGNDAQQKGWIDASPMAVAYYMNPYTFIGNEVTILQFEALSWTFGNDIVRAEGIVETMLHETFMSKTSNERNTEYVDDGGNIKYKDASGHTIATSQTYANAICLAAKAENLNPCYLAAKILGEVGSAGSGSTTGTYGNYKGYYNYLNVGATDSSDGAAVSKGLATAKSNGWDTPQKSISGGAKTISDGYLKRGQNTSYLQKFNVTKNGTYNHQYMTAVNGVVNTTYNTHKGYKQNGILDIERTFIIPVFENMPTKSESSITLNGYTNVAKTNDTLTVRTEPGIGYKSNGSVAKGREITNYGGFRDQRVTYMSEYGKDSTYYRMYTPLWYKIDSRKYLYEDGVDVYATANLMVGKTLQLGCSNHGSEKPRYMVQDTRIATVDRNGKITAKAPGKTKAVAYLVNGSFAVLNLNVSYDPANGPTEVTSPSLSINNSSSFISKVSSGTTVSSFRNQLNENGYVEIRKNGSVMSDSDVISTGCVVNLIYNGTTRKSYSVVVTGDINSSNNAADGKISITDLLAVRDELLSSNGILSGANYKAADINADGKISITDLIKVRDHLLGLENITPRQY